MKITVRIEKQWGHERIFPVDDKAKDILNGLSGGQRKCFTRKHIEFIKTMGVEVEVERPTI